MSARFHIPEHQESVPVDKLSVQTVSYTHLDVYKRQVDRYYSWVMSSEWYLLLKASRRCKRCLSQQTTSVTNVWLRSSRQRKTPSHSTNMWEAEKISLDGPIHPPYSPDLSPCDYHLFGPLKQALGGKRFDDDTGVKEFMCNWVQPCSSSFFREGVKKFPSYWRKCISKSGDYVEKWYNNFVFFYWTNRIQKENSSLHVTHPLYRLKHMSLMKHK